MKYAIKRLCDIPNVVKLRQLRRACSQNQYEHEILSELAQLSREKTWLNKEKKNWLARINQINERMIEVEKIKEILIQKQEALKEQMVFGGEKDCQTSGKKANEMILKY